MISGVSGLKTTNTIFSKKKLRHKRNSDIRYNKRGENFLNSLQILFYSIVYFLPIPVNKEA